MNQFTTPRVFQAKPSQLKKKIALIAFAVGAIALTLALTGVIDKATAGPYFACGIVAMIFAFRFWNMQVRNPSAVTFDATGITIADKSATNTVPWAELASIRYRVWRGGHFWEFKSRIRGEAFEYYVDGLSSVELNELRETISSIKLPEVLIEPVYNPF
jgi:hypothetical protein